MTKPKDKSEGAEPTIEEKEPGLYESIFDDYPGYIRFPHPFLYTPHFQEYWEKAIEPQADLTKIRWNAQYLPWVGAKHLIIEYGEWAIKGVTVADVKKDALPLKVQQWVQGCARHYLEPELDPKAWAALSMLI